MLNRKLFGHALVVIEVGQGDVHLIFFTGCDVAFSRLVRFDCGGYAVGDL